MIVQSHIYGYLNVKKGQATDLIIHIIPSWILPQVIFYGCLLFLPQMALDVYLKGLKMAKFDK